MHIMAQFLALSRFIIKYSTTHNSSINKLYHNDGARIAESVYLSHLIQTNLIEATGANNRGVKEGALAVLRETAIPATLLEFGFIDNKQELSQLTNDDYQNNMIHAVANGRGGCQFKTLY